MMCSLWENGKCMITDDNCNGRYENFECCSIKKDVDKSLQDAKEGRISKLQIQSLGD